jgi:hypothetical protein
MSEENENVEEVKTEGRKVTKKVAPAVAVSSPVVAKTIDDLYVAYPGERFMYAAQGTPAENLAEEGLEIVLKNGQPMTSRGRLICRCIGKTQATKMAQEYSQASESISAVRDIKTSDKRSKTPEASNEIPTLAED